MPPEPDLSPRPRRALVTGGTGFIGSHLIGFLLRQGWQVYLLVHSAKTHLPGVSMHSYDGTLTSIHKALDLCQPDVVFHLASLFLAQHTPQQVTPLIQTNVLLGTQLLEGMTSVGVRALVNAGTSWQHFANDTYRPVNLYAATKQAFQDILAYYCDTGAIRSVTLKLFDSYGPGDGRGKLLSLLTAALQSGAALQLSGGEQVIDLVHVDDLCRAFLRAADLLSDPRQVAYASYAVSGGERQNLRGIVALLEELADRKLAVEWGGKPYRPREVMLPWEGPPLPGWHPVISLETGLRTLLKEAPDRT